MKSKRKPKRKLSQARKRRSGRLQDLLLEAVQGPHAPYSREELEAILEKIRENL